LFKNRYIKHFKNCREIKKIISNPSTSNLKNKLTNINNLYWYDLNIKYASSYRGYFKVITWSYGRLFLYYFNKYFFRYRSKSNIDKNYQLINPKNYGAEPIYIKNIIKTSADLSNPTIWHSKSIKSKPWFVGDKWSDLLEENIETFKSEYNFAMNQKSLHPGNEMLARGGKWESIVFYGFLANKKISKFFKKSINIIKRMPLCLNFGFVSFSILSPGTHLLPHTGANNLRLRYHLGISVPESGLTKIRVGNETKSWEQDKCLILDDSFEHEVTHKGKEDRVIMLVDLWHPSLSEDEIQVLSYPVFNKYGKLK
tara:strand:+ start:637 stop:1572 length:936 start_codon:yes stop_codon:yes gene_type:complete